MNNTPSHAVGPVLEAGELAQAVVIAIRQLNNGVQVQNRGAYWRVLVPQRCEVTRASIEGVLGRSFQLPMDLERIMPSFAGLMEIDEDHAIWFFNPPVGKK